MSEMEGRLSGSFTYSADVFSSTKAAAMAGHGTLLESVVANPQQRILNLTMMSPVELDQVTQWARSQLAG